ncbi:hypothetical protein ABZV91_01855 [Nocardia sp. NPDC004568]|uniref:hypothetical protein n=1 Tax=Nocardia sp. NPDC004568 TaxID=3154551 RepID=UPI0033AEED0B
MLLRILSGPPFGKPIDPIAGWWICRLGGRHRHGIREREGHGLTADEVATVVAFPLSADAWFVPEAGYLVDGCYTIL